MLESELYSWGTTPVSGTCGSNPQRVEVATGLSSSFVQKRAANTLLHRGLKAAKVRHLKKVLQMPASMKTCGLVPAMTYTYLLRHA